MPVIETDKWLEKHLYDPISICEKIKKSFQEDNPRKLYEFLNQFGMYKPNRTISEEYDHLIKNDTWLKVNQLLERYRKKWAGPDIPIYIFPFSNSHRNIKPKKSGVSFIDKMFLFLVHMEDEIELESLFVHEYHHVCRMNRQNKKANEYTIMDSIIMEGLAEDAVTVNCGEKYNAEWCEYYTNQELKDFWNQVMKENINIKKDEELHDQLLYGLGRFPRMIGYSLGFELVKIYKQKKSFSEKTSFFIKSEQFIP